jgi:hypothetical protein
MSLKRYGLRSLFAAAALFLFAASAHAFNVANVTIQKIHSPNVHGHLYVVISGVSNCPDNPQAYFIIPGWLETTEPGVTYRKTMLALILSAHASGKTLSVTGAQCYLNRYLLADELVVNE